MMPEKEKPEKEKKTPAAGAAGAAESGEAAARLDQLIASVEKVYEALTGTSPPASEETRSPIPVERDPGEFVSERLERLLAAFQQPAAAPTAVWSPPISVLESEREMVVCLDLAGVRRDAVTVTVDGNALIVRGSRAPADEDGLKLRLSERPLGSFERRIHLPQRVDLAEPEARLEDGVLAIRLPKLSPVAAGRREVRVA